MQFGQVRSPRRPDKSASGPHRSVVCHHERVTDDAAAPASAASSRPAVEVSLGEVLRHRASLLGTIVIDSLFVALVAGVNLITARALRHIPLEEPDQLALDYLQRMFAFSTIALVAVALLRDLLIALARVWQR